MKSRFNNSQRIVGDLWPCFDANQLENPYNEILITALISDTRAGPSELHIGRLS